MRECSGSGGTWRAAETLNSGVVQCYHQWEGGMEKNFFLNLSNIKSSSVKTSTLNSRTEDPICSFIPRISINTTKMSPQTLPDKNFLLFQHGHELTCSTGKLEKLTRVKP